MKNIKTMSLIRNAENAKQLAGVLTHDAMEAVKSDIDEIIVGSTAPADFWSHIDERCAEGMYGGYTDYLASFTQEVHDLLTLWFRLYTSTI